MCATVAIVLAAGETATFGTTGKNITSRRVAVPSTRLDRHSKHGGQAPAIAGHVDRGTTLRYMHLSPTALENAINCWITAAPQKNLETL
jgi:hypothetical protein